MSRYPAECPVFRSPGGIDAVFRPAMLTNGAAGKATYPRTLLRVMRDGWAKDCAWDRWAPVTRAARELLAWATRYDR